MTAAHPGDGQTGSPHDGWNARLTEDEFAEARQVIEARLTLDPIQRGEDGSIEIDDMIVLAADRLTAELRASHQREAALTAEIEKLNAMLLGATVRLMATETPAREDS